MIRVVKPEAPTILLTKGVDEARQLCADYDASPDDYKTGAKTFDFKSSIYAATEVKLALRNAQHDKCAFCESKVSHVAYGDVEHYRPKAGYKIKPDDELKRPGYYWLAYEWSNLFFACQLCNQRFKRNLFPLKNNRGRARSHTHDLDKEEPLLINPGADEPSDYLGFREEYAFAIEECAKGAATVDVVGLNRAALVEQRLKELVNIKVLRRTRNALRKRIKQNPDAELAEQLARLDELLERRRDATAEYSAMARACVDET